MLRKSTALMFMLVMTLLIALKHPVLGYCLCLDSITVSCSASECAVKKSVCDDGCSNHCSENLNESHTQGEEDTPCEDCLKMLNLDVGDFIWSVDGGLSSTSELNDSVSSDLTDDQHTSGRSVHFSNSLRGPPTLGLSSIVQYSHNTPGLNGKTVDLPIYLKLSVLKI